MTRRGNGVPLFLALFAAACSEQASEVAQPAATARVEPGEYPTIVYAEPAALSEDLPAVTPGALMPEPRFSAEDAGRFLRILPHTEGDLDAEGLPRPVPAIAHYGTLILRDGCLWLTGSTMADRDVLAVLPPAVEARVDADGHLVIGRGGEHPLWARIGEPLMFGLTLGEITPETEAALRGACGEAPIRSMSVPTSYYDWQRHEAARNAPRAAEIHGVTVAVARQNMLAELRANEARRKICTLNPDESCNAREVKPGEPIDSWLMVWPPEPPASR